MRHPFVAALLSVSVLALSACATTSTEVADVQPMAEAPAEPAAAEASAQVAAGAEIGSFGFDIEGMDRAIQPGDSFYDFANGNWDRTTEIPADQANYGMFTKLAELSRDRTRVILEEAARQPGNKIGDFYSSFMDEAAIEAAGLAPLQPQRARIRAIADRRAFAAEAGRLLREGVGGPFGGGVTTDNRDPTQMVVRLGQSGIGLPDRDYYLSNDAQLTEKRNAYQAYLAQLLTLAGESNAAARAAAIVALEKQFAQAHWTRVENRNPDKTYNRRTMAELKREAPGFDWAAWMEPLGFASQQSVLVSQPTAVKAMAATIGSAGLPVLKDLLLVRLLDSSAPFLPKAFVDANFAFRGTVLNGTPQNEDRWKRGVDLVSGSLADDVSRIYVQRHFPPEAKAQADELVRNVIAAMDRRLANLPWMAPETKARARAKLAAFTPKIGYPSEWRDYSDVQVSRNDLIQNVRNARAYEYQRNLAKLGAPVNREEWFMTPMTVNAYANPTWNEIVFPAAILQPPFFDPKADPAINYGGIGAVIGHEISHHFDDQGSKYDEKGALNEWWTAQDRERFNALTGQLVQQYAAYEPLPGRKLNGQLTLGENIADLAGLTVAYDAYQTHLGGRPAPVIDGFTGVQRFYLGWAQVWRRKYREANLVQRLLTDSHSPSEQRAAVVRNLDPWYDAFNPAPGSQLYLAPEQRVRIW